MTTVACKGGVMACDSCWTDSSDMIGTSKNKITRLRSGALLGEAGDNDSRAVQALLQNVKRFKSMPLPETLAKCSVDYTAIILFPNGEVAQISIERKGEAGSHYIGGAWPVNRGCTAVGSGSHLAVGAMSAGKSAREAVAIACNWDPYSKLPVHTWKCEPIRKRARRSKASRKTARKAQK